MLHDEGEIEGKLNQYWIWEATFAAFISESKASVVYNGTNHDMVKWLELKQCKQYLNSTNVQMKTITGWYTFKTAYILLPPMCIQSHMPQTH